MDANAVGGGGLSYRDNVYLLLPCERRGGGGGGVEDEDAINLHQAPGFSATVTSQPAWRIRQIERGEEAVCGSICVWVV